MKNILILISVCSLFLASSCSDDNSIIGTWTITETDCNTIEAGTELILTETSIYSEDNFNHDIVQSNDTIYITDPLIGTFPAFKINNKNSNELELFYFLGSCTIYSER